MRGGPTSPVEHASLRMYTFTAAGPEVREQPPNQRRGHPRRAPPANRTNGPAHVAADARERRGRELSATPELRKGVNRIGTGRLHAIARFLEVPVTYFFEGVDEPSSKAPRAPDLGAITQASSTRPPGRPRRWRRVPEFLLPSRLLAGFKPQEDRFDNRLQTDPRFLRRMAGRAAACALAAA